MNYPNCPKCLSDLFTRVITKECGCVKPKNHRHNAWWCDDCCKEFK